MRRRQFLIRFGTGAAALVAARPVLAQAPAGTPASEFGVRPGAPDDQSASFQRMVDEAARRGVPVLLPAGIYVVSNIVLPERTVLHGVPGGTQLVQGGDGPLLTASGSAHLRLGGLMVDGVGRSARPGGLIDLRAVADLRLDDLTVRGAGEDGLRLERCGGLVAGCTIAGAARFGIHAVDSAGLTVRDNDVGACANGGIIVHRSVRGSDGTVIAGNRITDIGAANGGTGQWGNAINLFRADDVLVTGNRISGAAFSAIRGNAAGNIQIVGNNCRASGETAIYSEFGFENAIIADNLVDGAANGISVTNFNDGGRGGTVSDNIVRNLVARGPYEPDAPGFGTGIAVEADTAVTGNLVEGAALFGINAGWGPYLRDCVIASNIVRNARFGIGVSAAPGAGRVLVRGNLIDAREGAVRAHRWAELVPGDLTAARQAVPDNIVLDGNRAA